eukprot:6196148-Pleurochrysis_carterae.AAC.4
MCNGAWRLRDRVCEPVACMASTYTARTYGHTRTRTHARTHAHVRERARFLAPPALSSAHSAPFPPQVVTGSFDKTAKLWNAETGELLHTLRGHQTEIVCLSFDPHGALPRSSGTGSAPAPRSNALASSCSRCGGSLRGGARKVERGKGRAAAPRTWPPLDGLPLLLT